MGISIHPVDTRDAHVAEGFVAEYLDDVEAWRDCVRSAPHLAWWATGPDLVGVCYGTSNAGEVVLQGLAVTYKFQRHGIGSGLLRAFEGAAAAHGGERVTLGSGPGGVELFYLSNDYAPIGYLFTFSSQVSEDDLEDLTITRYRPGKDTTLVNATNPDGYAPDKREQLKERYGASEAIYIFAKGFR